MNLGLSPLALEIRKTGLYGTDAKRIIEGDWKRLYREKKDLAEPEDLSDILRVQLGIFTEPFNLAWCQKLEGRAVEYFTGSDWQAAAWQQMTGEPANRREQATHPTMPWLRGNRDALSTTRRGAPCYLDAKHVGRADEATLTRYQAQMHHMALVCGVEWFAMSFFVGNSKWEYYEAEIDPFFCDELVGLEREFMGFLERGEEPPDRTPVPPPKPARMLRTVDLNDANKPYWPNWGPSCLHFMGDFAATKAAADRHFIARESIKKLVPDDVGEVKRGEFTIKRNKADALVFHIPKPVDDPLAP
jgi:hypothetical protein